MSDYGLRVCDANGKISVTINNRINRRILSITYSLNPSASLFYSVPGLVLDGTWAVLHAPVAYGTGMTDDLSVHARISVSSGGFYLQNAWTVSVSGKVDVVRF
jgi:hypothetical protein